MAENPQPSGQGNAQPEQNSSQQGSAKPEGGASQAATEYPYQPAKPGITDENYRQDPAWKKAQAGFQRTINDLQGQVAALQAQREQELTKNMSEAERATYEAQRWREAAMQQAQRNQEIVAAQQRDEDLYRISQKTGVDVNDLRSYVENTGTNSAFDVWDYAWDKARQSVTQAQQPYQSLQQGQQPYAPQSPQQQGTRQQPPPVNVGGGAPPTTASQIQERYDKARESFDMDAMFGAMREADMAGVELREW